MRRVLQLKNPRQQARPDDSSATNRRRPVPKSDKKRPTVLEVWLNQTRVGTITNLPYDQNLFVFDEECARAADRPVLSLSFYDDSRKLSTEPEQVQAKVPSFFSNLLPEGRLREYLAEVAGVKETREFFLLWAAWPRLAWSRDSSRVRRTTFAAGRPGEQRDKGKPPGAHPAIFSCRRTAEILRDRHTWETANDTCRRTRRSLDHQTPFSALSVGTGKRVLDDEAGGCRRDRGGGGRPRSHK